MGIMKGLPAKKMQKIIRKKRSGKNNLYSNLSSPSIKNTHIHISKVIPA